MAGKKKGTGSGIFVERNGKRIELLNTRSAIEINGRAMYLDQMTKAQREYVVTKANLNGMRDYYAKRGLVISPVEELPPFEELFAEYL